MERKLIISEQPKCKTCDKLMQEWNPFAEVHEHIECSAERISVSLVEVLKKELYTKVN